MASIARHEGRKVMDAMQILVIILSIFLAIFLAVGIALTVILIKISQKIKAIADTAETTVQKAQSIAGNINALTSPNSLVKVGQAFVKGFKK